MEPGGPAAATRAALVTKRRPLICATSKKVKPLEAAEAVLQLDRRVDEVDGADPPEARVLLLERLLGVAAELAVEEVARPRLTELLARVGAESSNAVKD